MHRDAMLFGLALLLVPGALWAGEPAAPLEAASAAAPGTPPRLSYLAGPVSFWRVGAKDWAPARVNTAMAASDELYTGEGGNLELQIDGRAFLRAGEGSQLGLATLEPDFLQFDVSSGHVSLDVRSLPPGYTVELSTPHAAFRVELPGYYRLDVAAKDTTFVTRRGGQALMSPTHGSTVRIAPSEEAVVQGGDQPTVETYVAPELDDWDRWNYARTDQIIDAMSTRYVGANMYGAADLDQYGSWRIVGDYGPLWIPADVAAGWVPYSTGSWIWDPYYHWTWVDDAPWGWAPFHYGRWVFVDGFWGWAPGPIELRSIYAPALVVFFGGVSLGVQLHGGIGWVALGWGEPLFPWWGVSGFIGVPWWGGWGGPRIVNNVVINKTTIVHASQVTHFQNARHHALVVVDQRHFGHGPLKGIHLASTDGGPLGTPLRGALSIKPTPAALEPATGAAAHPPKASVQKSAIATKRAHHAAPAGEAHPAPPHPLTPPQGAKPGEGAPPAPFGKRPGPVRPPGPAPKAFSGAHPGVPLPEPQAAAAGPAHVPADGLAHGAPPPPYAGEGAAHAKPPAPSSEARPAGHAPLPGHPANQLRPRHAHPKPSP